MFQGVAPPIITPFDKHSAIKEDSLRELIDWWIGKGVNAIVPCGSNGEVVYLDFEERIRVLEVTIDHVDGRVPVIAGTGFPDTQRTIQMTKQAKDLGADGALVVSPYYYSITNREMVCHYQAVAGSTDIPIFLYNVPKFTHYSFSPTDVKELSKIDNIVGIKESSGNIGFVQDIIRATGDENFDLLAGTGGLFSTILHTGAKGGILALANIAPAKCARIFEYHFKGQEEAAQKLNYDLVNLNAAITKRYAVPGLKCAMNLRGLPAGTPRLPYRKVDSETKEKIKAILEEASLL